MNANVRQKLIAAFVAVGLTSTGAFVAYDLTLPSEGLVTKVYVDPVGLPTVCVGHMDTKLPKGKTFTLEECMKMFAEDFKKHQAQLDSIVKVPYASEWQRGALADFTFNVGITQTKSSTLIKLVNEKKHKAACEQLTRWVYAGGKKLKGLVVRAENRMPYCLGELSYDQKKSYEEFKKEFDAAVKEKNSTIKKS